MVGEPDYPSSHLTPQHLHQLLVGHILPPGHQSHRLLQGQLLQGAFLENVVKILESTHFLPERSA